MEMGELGAKNNNNNNNNNSRVGGVGVGVGCRPHTTEKTTTTAATTTAAQSTDFVLQWGNRKRLRCMKIQVKNNSTSSDRTTRVRVDRGVVLRSNNNNNNRDSCSNLRRHFSSPPPPPPSIPIPHRISPSSRNCEGSSGAMKGQSNGVAITSCSAEEKAQDNKRNNVNGGSASSETAQDSKKGGGSSSGSDAIAVWLPKFVISLTNKEKEEDFMAIKGSKLPQRPKKRAKFIQRTLNFVSPGSLLCDLTLERYEVREKKISKKRPRGLKAMGNMESDSE